MVSVRLPYYYLGGYWIDAYLINTLEIKYNRILLIRDNASNEPPTLKPLPYDHVVSLLREGYLELNELINEIENKIKNKSGLRRSLEIILLPLYNPSQYLARNEDSVVVINVLRFLVKLYDKLLSKMPKEPLGLGSVELSIRGGSILINGKVDKVLTNLYSIDEGFRRGVDEALRGFSSV
ncbi:hypothetical protein [Vulcanisaeta thermophila]|uniref:hypothetical protein n=1 Tax=Vulcanisaeta thermophila TaxID=867917 RepID=UPI0008531B8F|nr:hypothetical protein [Vulcanisaeta thermophila]